MLEKVHEQHCADMQRTLDNLADRERETEDTIASLTEENKQLD